MYGFQVKYRDINMFIDEEYTKGFGDKLNIAVDGAINELEEHGLTPLIIFVRNCGIAVHSRELKSSGPGVLGAERVAVMPIDGENSVMVAEWVIE